MKKKIILIGSISLVVICVASFLLLSKSKNNSEEITDANCKYVAAKSGINLRSAPGKSSKAISLIPFGEKVTVEKSDGDEIFLDDRYGKWVNVKYGNKTGWVFSGFLCDFEPSTIIKPVADFYRDKYSKLKYYSDDERFTHFKDSQVYIKDIIDNYIVLSLEILNYRPYGDFVWMYDVKRKKFFEVYSEDDDKRVHFLYLDNDKHLDLVINKARGTEALGIEILLGSENGLIKIYDSFDDGCCDMHDGYFLNIGRCGDTEFAYGYDEDTMHFFRFNCNNRKFEKYAESKVIISTGIVASVDLKNGSFVVKDNKDLKDTTYKIHDKFFSYDDRIKYLKDDLQKGKKISFIYVIIDGKKEFMRFWDETNFL